MFHYNGYWGRWSRVLSENHPRGPFIEVNLTPIPNNYGANTWQKDVAPIRIRVHDTIRDYREAGTGGDKRADTLPADIRAAMVAHLGVELTERLLTEDFLLQIDFDRHNRVSNGGANLEDIRLQWHKPSCPCFSNFYSICSCGYWPEGRVVAEKRLANYRRVSAMLGVKQANCGCVYHTEEGVPCEHDMALVAEKFGGIPQQT